MADDHEITTLMADPATHAGAAVTVLRTHGAQVFLAGPWAYKLKRAVRYPYLDFTAAATRRAMLGRELALNRPAAPQIYDRLVPLTRGADGRLTLDGPGPPEEWALRMHRFDPAAQLSQLAADGRLTPALASALGQAVAELHAAAPIRPVAGAAAVAAVIDGLAVSFAALRETLGPGGGAFLAAARAAVARHAGLLDRRAAAGWVRRCHGDLHLGNLVVVDARPVPFDALEFDEALATTDVLYDLAFLLMDLDRAGCRRAANAVLNRWLHRMGWDAQLEGLALLPLFLGLRAAIRAMVAAQTAPGAPDPAAARTEARAALAAARGFLAPPPARLVAVGGLSGSGKSTLAARLAPAIGPAPGAVVLRSDLLRKAMAGVDDTDRLPPESYTPAAADAVYGLMRAHAGRVLAAGHGVVLDAVHLSQGERAAVADLARRAGLDAGALWLDTPPERLLARVAARSGDASDADGAVVRAQIAAAGAVRDWPHLDGAGPPEGVAHAARAALGLADTE